MRVRLRVALAAAVGACVLVSAATASASLVHFRSPSGNINCYLGATFADCLVRRNTWPRKPVKPRSCDLDFNPAEIAVSAGRLTIGACRGDVGPLCGLGNDRCVVLAYGRSATRGPLRCESSPAGVTCRFVTGRRRGFTIAREGYRLYR
jgi:hypothetical protein